MKKSELFKILALASVGAFAYYQTREKGQMMSGDPDSLVDKVMPWLNVNPQIKPIVRMGMLKAAEQVISPNGRKKYVSR
jgi:hypothetical protein